MLLPQIMKPLYVHCWDYAPCRSWSLRASGIGIVFVQHVSNQPPNQSTRCHDKEDTFSTNRRGDPMSHIDRLTAGCVRACVRACVPSVSIDETPSFH